MEALGQKTLVEVHRRDKEKGLVVERDGREMPDRQPYAMGDAMLGFDNRLEAPIAGDTWSVLIMDIFMGGSLTGASMNPARSLGPALAWTDYPMDQLWIYLAGPAIGAVAGVFVAKAIHSET